MAYSPKNANGQATMANSEPVVIASDQSAVPVSGTFYQATQPVSLASVPSHAVTNAGTFAVQVTSAPSTTVTATDLDIRNLTNVDVVTAELSAVDNAVLNAIEADTTTIAAKDFATEATLVTVSDNTLDVSNATVVDDALFTVATSRVVMDGFLFDDVAPDSVNEGDAGAGRMSANRNQYVQVRDAAGNERGLNIAADGSLAVTVATVPSHAVTNAGTFATQENGALLTAAQLIDDTVFADDAAVTLGTSKGNIFAGVAVQTDGTDPTAVSAEGDAAALRTDMNRILLVNQTHPRGSTVSADYASAQTNTSVIAAPGASLSIYITDIMLSNGATAGNVTLLDGSGGTVKWEAYPAVNGGAVLTGLRQPIKLTANTALCLTSTTVTTHSIFIGYYIAA